jgi:biopolymer transport protein ExbD
MATIDVGKSSAREVNREVPLIPFIDFLLTLISFLLITAIWSQNARLDASAQVPGVESIKADEQPKRLHLDVRDRKFELTWKQGHVVLAREELEKQPILLAGEPRYPALSERIQREWEQSGTHKAARDPKLDQLVLHSANDLEFGELAAVLDAIAATSRARELGGETVRVPAFSVSFAVN